SDLAEITVHTSEHGLGVASLELGEAANQFATPCWRSGLLPFAAGIPSNGSVQQPGGLLETTDPTSGELRQVRASLHFGVSPSDAGMVTGTISIAGVTSLDSGAACATRSITFAAVARASADAVAAGARFAGSVAGGETFEGLAGDAGSADFTTDAAGS